MLETCRDGGGGDWDRLGVSNIVFKFTVLIVSVDRVGYSRIGVQAAVEECVIDLSSMSVGNRGRDVIFW